ncbi:MAG: ribonuclease M5 [Finegoldia sp.]|nr:ribonuclease M5 [Finegoldia sp.]
MIKEIIVVEGRDDEQRVKAAIDCEVVTTGGIYFSNKLLNRLKEISKKRGIIVLTDPDYAGNKIRERINRHIPQAKNAYVPRRLCTKEGDIGIENAKAEDILAAIEKAHPSSIDIEDTFDYKDMVYYGLAGENSKEKRIEVGDKLGIGYANAKSFLRKLNNYGIKRDELEKILNDL